MTIIDTNHDCTSKLTRLKNAGVTMIIRYLNRRKPSGEKVIKPAEAKAFAKAGMRLGLVYEYNADINTLTEENGYLDAKWSLQWAPTIGMPHLLTTKDAGPAVYFAVDLDPTKRQVERNVVPYFKGIARARGGTMV